MSKSEKVISVSNVSKSYKISHQLERNAHPTLRDDLVHYARKPLEWIGAAGGKTKEEFWALKDIGFEVNQGDVLGIMGKNGSGKSTLFKILSRITQPTTGKIVIDGKTASLLEVGTGFHNELTGRENVFFNGAVLGMSKSEINKKFDDIVAFSEVEKFLDTPVKFYSSGMKVRLAFSVAAFLDSEILIIDEVLAVGDVRFKRKSLDRMKEISREEGRTVLFVSHIVHQIEQVCTRGLVLHDGQMVLDDSIEKTIEKYLEINESSEDPDGDETARGGQNISSNNISVESIGVEVTKPERTGKAPGLEINLAINNNSIENKESLWVGFIISNKMGVNVTIVSNQLAGEKLELDKHKKKAKVKIRISDLNLVPDQYFLKAAVRPVNEADNLYFSKERAASFEIQPYEYGSMKSDLIVPNIPPTRINHKVNIDYE